MAVAHSRRSAGDRVSRSRRRWLAPAAVLAVVAFPHPAGAAPPTDEERAVLERFAPVVAIRHQAEPCGDGERFLPVAVDAVLGREDVVLRDADDEVVVTAPSAADLAGGGPDLWLDLPGETLDPGCSYEQWFDTLDAAPAMYGRLTTEQDHLVAQYWFFWVYNQWNDVHEGDWEMVQLVFDTASPAAALDAGPETYAYAQHEGSEYATVGENDDRLVLVDGVRPVVFAAQGSHAAYFSSSRWFGKSAATGFGCDDTSSPIDQIEPELLFLPGDDVPTSGPLAWLSYEGHWGQQAPSFNNGPTGPVSKSQWAAPVTWVDDEGRDSAVALPFAGSRATDTFCDLSAAGSQLFIRFLRQPLLVLAALVVAVVATVLVVRRSSRGVLSRAARAWRADAARMLRIGTLVLVGAVVASVAQWAVLRWTRLGTLVDTVGASSAWVLPLLAVVGSLVAAPVLAWTVAATIRATRHPAVERVVADVAARRRPAIWTTLVLTVAVQVAVFLFPPLLVLCSRWLVAPVVSSEEGTSTRGALGASHRLVRGHGWRAVGMVITLLLVAAIAGVAGALVLLLTSLTFTAVAVVTSAVGVVVVPYLALVVLAFHDTVAATAPLATPDHDPDQEGP
jgi:hypothetical protein